MSSPATPPSPAPSGDWRPAGGAGAEPLGAGLPAAVLEALPVHVALLDGAGHIRFVNRAWRQFAEANGLRLVDGGLGENYLAVCAAARGPGGEEAAAAAAGLRRVLAGEAPEFALEYPCHSPDEPRWFRLVAVPVPLGAGRGAVVMHLNITERWQAEEARRAGELDQRRLAQNLTATLESITDAFFTLDREWRFTFLNREAERLLARPREELAGRVLWTEFPAAVGSTFEREYRRALAEDRTVAFEEFYPPLHAWFAVRAYPSDQGLAVYFRDITESRRAEARLRESEERFRLLAKATNDAVWDWDMEADVLWWNEGHAQLFGQDPGGAGPSYAVWEEHVHPEDRARVVEHIRRVTAGGGDVFVNEYRYRRADGTYASVLDRAHIMRDATGRPVRMVGAMSDQTERRRTEEKLREQAALLDQANDAILVRDLAHRVVYWNRSAERLYGWTAAEALGRSVEELLYGIAGTFREAMKVVLATGEWAGEIEQFTKDGRTVTVAARWTRVNDAQGRPAAILAINTDVTARKQLERQFLRAQRMESIGTLAGGIAHDLNNLLAPIVMGTGLLQRYDLPDPGREVLRNIEHSARRGADLVKQVLAFARGVEGERIPLQPRHLISEIGAIVANTFPKNITFAARLEPDLRLVRGDATQLNQVLLNLCVNARDAMPAGGRLTITAANATLDRQFVSTDHTVPAGRYVVIEVTDTGVGMARDVLDRIFEPFFTTKELGKGTGLGLCTALGIVRSHGGALTVQSEPGRGSTFRLWLPEHADPAAAEAPAAPEAVLRPGHGELILVVDDEAPVLAITAQTLEALGYRVLTAADGAQAVGLYAQHRQDVALVLTDLMMPVMDGPMLIASLQRIHPGVRIIAASGLHTSDYLARAVALGVVHFLNKPFSAGDLLALLQKVLAEPGPVRPPAASA